MTLEKFYLMQEAATILKMSKGNLYQLKYKGKIKISHDAGGRPIIWESDLHAFMNKTTKV